MNSASRLFERVPGLPPDGNNPRSNARSAANARDQQLIARFHAGESGAFRVLITPHFEPLLALAFRVVTDKHWAEDLVQEVLVRAHAGLGDFRGEASLRTWLFRILVRLAGEPKRWRKDGPDKDAIDVAETIPDHLEPLPVDHAIERELRERFDEALERLTTRQRTALHLRAVEGMDYDAVAEVLQCSRGAARMAVLAARRHMTKRLGGSLES